MLTSRSLRRLALGAAMIVLAASAPAWAQTPSVRTVTLRIAVDREFLALGEAAAIEPVVERVSSIYEQHFQLRFRITEVVPWAAAAPLSLRSDDLDAIVSDALPDRGSADIVVVVSGHSCVPKETSGATIPFGSLIILKPRCARGPLAASMVRVLSHELAHVFGAFHVVRKGSLMRDGPADAFDDQTARVIRLMRELDFTRGVDSIDDTRRRAFVEIFEEGHRPRVPNPLASALARKGNTLLLAGHTSEAIARAREAIRLESTYAPAHRVLGMALAQEKRLDEATDALREAARLEPRSAVIHRSLGTVLRARGRLDAAMEELREALTLEPRAAVLHHELALTLALAGRKSEARLHLEQGRALGMEPPRELLEALRPPPARR